MRILIVEDNIELTRQIKSTLEHALYVVDVAFDGEEGLLLICIQKCTTNPPYLHPILPHV